MSQLKNHFKVAIEDFSKIALHPAMKFDMRITGPFYAASQRFVQSAEAVGIKQDPSAKTDKRSVDTIQELTKNVKLFANAAGDIDSDLTDQVQELVNEIQNFGVTATERPIPGQPPKMDPQDRSAWGNRPYRPN